MQIKYLMQIRTFKVFFIKFFFYKSVLVANFSSKENCCFI